MARHPFVIYPRVIVCLHSACMQFSFKINTYQSIATIHSSFSLVSGLWSSLHDRWFAAACPRALNMLLASLRLVDNCMRFRRLKAHYFSAGSCFSKIFCIKSRETITECMQLFNCQSVKNVADKRMRSFKQKYSASSNSLCKLFI